MEHRIDLTQYRALPLGNKLRRALWNATWLLLFRPSPVPFFAWRRALLTRFGARIGKDVHIYPSCRIWAPWNLRVDDHSWIGHGVDCYSVDTITIGANAVVSQYSVLCTASHDEQDPAMRLVTSPIVVEDQAWVCDDVFVAPGVTIGQGAVAGARSSVFRNLPPWMVCVGSPAKPVRARTLHD
ncbi:MAG: colanic acid biosynthesis acetyltransferase WcaF [Ignavibacteria bacterium]|nr:colanic acid biosynthesis acetyltransferase WcaF [Ignavibacteria bacterium]